MKRRATILLVLLALLPAGAGAHPLAPALLQLSERAPGEYEVLWRTSVTRAARDDVAPELPTSCRPQAPARIELIENEAVEQRWRVACGGDLAGETIGVGGLGASGINVILRLERQGAAPAEALLDARSPVHRVAPPARPPPVFGQYLRLGVAHLLGGADHLLFVLGLLVLVRGRGRLLLTISAFTVGHSLTLAAATLGWLRVDSALMELGIAASLLWLAGEILRPRDAAPRAWLRAPGTLALGFGLLHGLGFAGALGQAGLPQASVPLALLAFNLGIELGQLAVVGAALLLAALARAQGRGFEGRPWATAVPAYVIGALAAHWCLERAATWWNG